MVGSSSKFVNSISKISPFSAIIKGPGHELFKSHNLVSFSSLLNEYSVGLANNLYFLIFFPSANVSLEDTITKDAIERFMNLRLLIIFLALIFFK